MFLKHESLALAPCGSIWQPRFHRAEEYKDTYLIHGLGEKFSHKLKELKMALLNVGGGRGVESLVGGGTEEVQGWIKDPSKGLLEKLLEDPVQIDSHFVETLKGGERVCC